MSTPARKRLMRDFKRLQQDPPAGISGAPQDNNIMLWNAVIFGYVQNKTVLCFCLSSFWLFCYNFIQYFYFFAWIADLMTPHGMEVSESCTSLDLRRILCHTAILSFFSQVEFFSYTFYNININFILWSFHPLGTFKLTLQFTEDYPNKPPTVRFVSRMFHPNSKLQRNLRMHWCFVFLHTLVCLHVDVQSTKPRIPT